MAGARETVMSGPEVRIRSACAVWLALFVPGCLGGQTTVPASSTQHCDPADAGELAAQVIGSHAYDVSWQRTHDGEVTDVSATRVTLDVEVAADSSLGLLKCTGAVPVTVELSSDDGIVEFSGTGKLSQATQLVLELDVSPLVLSGSIEFADQLTILLNAQNGPTLNAHGEPVP